MTLDGNPIRRMGTEILESPDGGMRDVVLVADAEGARNLSAGLVWIAPGNTIHEDSHPFDEVYYVVRGTAELILDGERHVMRAGDIVKILATRVHRVHNSSDEVFEIFWCIGGPLSEMAGVETELASWPRVDAAEGWHLP
jgi:quercetin dioxygenase-like cupin family protein